MRRSYDYEHDYSMHEESWHSENERWSHGSGMHMLTGNHSPKHRTKYQDDYQDGWHNQNMLHQNGRYGSAAQQNYASSGKHKPYYGMADARFPCNDGMVSNSEYETSSAYYKVQGPAQAVRVEEEVYEHSSCANRYGNNVNRKNNCYDDAVWMAKGV